MCVTWPASVSLVHPFEGTTTAAITSDVSLEFLEPHPLMAHHLGLEHCYMISVC